MLESRGIPTVTVATDAFEELLHLEAEQRGLATLPFVIVAHPLGGLQEDAVRAKAAPVVKDLMAALTSDP